MVEYIFEVLDPHPRVGFISCADEAEAREYAAAVNGVVYRVGWADGEEVSREALP